MTDVEIQKQLTHDSPYITLAGATLLLGMATAAFTKAGKGKKAGAKVGFTFTGLFLLAGVALLSLVVIHLFTAKSSAADDKKV
jgi:hypothetical protein